MVVAAQVQEAWDDLCGPGAGSTGSGWSSRTWPQTPHFSPPRYCTCGPSWQNFRVIPEANALQILLSTRKPPREVWLVEQGCGTKAGQWPFQEKSVLSSIRRKDTRIWCRLSQDVLKCPINDIRGESGAVLSVRLPKKLKWLSLEPDGSHSRRDSVRRFHTPLLVVVLKTSGFLDVKR